MSFKLLFYKISIEIFFTTNGTVCLLTTERKNKNSDNEWSSQWTKGNAVFFLSLSFFLLRSRFYIFLDFLLSFVNDDDDLWLSWKLIFYSLFSDDKTGTLDGALDNLYCRSQMYLSRQMSRLRPELTMPIFSGLLNLTRDFFLFHVLINLQLFNRNDTSLPNSANWHSFLVAAEFVAVAWEYGVVGNKRSSNNFSAFLHHVLPRLGHERKERWKWINRSHGNDSQ